MGCAYGRAYGRIFKTVNKSWLVLAVVCVCVLFLLLHLLRGVEEIFH